MPTNYQEQNIQQQGADHLSVQNVTSSVNIQNKQNTWLRTVIIRLFRSSSLYGTPSTKVTKA